MKVADWSSARVALIGSAGGLVVLGALATSHLYVPWLVSILTDSRYVVVVHVRLPALLVAALGPPILVTGVWLWRRRRLRDHTDLDHAGQRALP